MNLRSDLTFENPYAEAACQLVMAFLAFYFLFTAIVVGCCMLVVCPIIVIGYALKILVENTTIFALKTFVYLKGDLHELR